MAPARSDSLAAARWSTALAAIWIVLVLAVFFRQNLPNNPAISRSDIAELMIDDLLGTGESPPVEVVPSGWSYLSQRVPIAGCGLLILFSAWSIGATVVGRLNVRLQLTRPEAFVFQSGVGLSLFSLWVLAIGTAGWLNRTVLFVPGVAATAWLLCDAVVSRRRASHHANVKSPSLTPRSGGEGQGEGCDETVTSVGQESAASQQPRPPQKKLSTRILEGLIWITLVGTAAWLVLGSMSPPTDFDVREYHLQGPKEWVQQGRITFLPHNVYTSFPFLSEMLSLAGMVAIGDWWTGALAGKFVLAAFALLTSLSVYCIGRRVADAHIGLLAALIHLTTPWTLRISIIAYAEGALSFYLTATVLGLLLLRTIVDRRDAQRLVLLIGCLAGSGMACKYTGLVSAVVPAAVVTAAIVLMRRSKTESQAGFSLMNVTALLAAGVLLAVGPWLLRNAVDTGNPVYPLAWSVFGGRDWDADVNERWKAAHSATEHSPQQIPEHVMDAAIRNDWTSPLLFALAIPALLTWKQFPSLKLLVGLAAWQFFAWWAFTHRIDRFWVPAIPLVAVIAACSRRVSPSQLWRVTVITVVVIATAFNLRFMTLPLIGYHAGLQDLTLARELVIRSDIRYLHDMLPDNARVLMVGEAEVFDCRIPVLYNTVFDASVFEQLTSTVDGSTSDPRQQRMKPPDEIRAALQQQGITHVLVNWSEILRYRRPGSYGYADYVQPARFQELVAAGVLSQPRELLSQSWSDMSDEDRAIIGTWDGAEFVQDGGLFQSVQLLEVMP